MIPILDKASYSPVQGMVTPLFGAYFANELITSIDSATTCIYAIEYQWRWNIHQRHSRVQQLGASIARACSRGVKVSVILNQESPKRPLTVINRVSANKLESLGCKVKMRRGGVLLHTKMFMIDNRYSFVGSHNISTRSLTANEEITCKIDSVFVAESMRQYFNRLLI